MVRPILALLIVLLPTFAWANSGSCVTGMCPLPTQRSPIQNPNTSVDIKLWPQVCRVSVQLADGTTGLGSGVWCQAPGREPAVLSAAHVVRGAISTNVICYFPRTGESLTGTVYARDNNLDVISIRLLGRPSIKPAKISEHAPRRGDSITLTGMGGSPRKGFLATAARATRWLMSTTRNTAANLLAVGAMSSQGDSGGPAWNEEGRVCGIITASNREFTVIATGPRDEGLQSLRDLLPPEPVQESPSSIPEQPPQEVPQRPAPEPEQEAQNEQVEPTEPEQAAPGASEADPQGEAGDAEQSPAATEAPVGSLAGAAAEAVAGGMTISSWTALAAALGVGGPLGLGIGVAGWLISRRLKQKLAEPALIQTPDPIPKPKQEDGTTDSPFRGQRDVTEAKQMLRMAHDVEGRNAVLDSLAGRIALDWLAEQLDSGTAPADRKGFAGDLKEHIYRTIDQLAPLAIRRAA
jgi:hypothetical protein